MQRSRHRLPSPSWLPLGLDCRGPLTACTHTLPGRLADWRTSGRRWYYWPPPPKGPKAADLIPVSASVPMT